MIPAASAGEGFDSLFRRSVKRNPGELIIFGNPEKVYSRISVVKAARAGNGIPAAIVEGLAIGLGYKISDKIMSGSKKNPLPAALLQGLEFGSGEFAIGKVLKGSTRRRHKASTRRRRHNLEHENKYVGGSWRGSRLPTVPEMAEALAEVYRGWIRSGLSPEEAEKKTIQGTAKGPAVKAAFRKIIGREGNLSPQYRAEQLAIAREKYAAARKAWDNAKTRAAKKRADEDLQFWGNKLAFLENARNPGRRRGRRNPADQVDQAADLYRDFQKRSPSGVYDLQVSAKRRREFTILGPLVAIGINSEVYDRERPRESDVVDHWDDLPHLAFISPAQVEQAKTIMSDPMRCLKKCTQLASSPNGKQLYAISEEPIELPGGIPGSSKDFVDLGDATFIVYLAAKPRDPVEYVHIFAEEGGERPRIGYARLAKEIFFIGGSYRVEAPGIIN